STRGFKRKNVKEVSGIQDFRVVLKLFFGPRHLSSVTFEFYRIVSSLDQMLPDSRISILQLPEWIP
ncbi:MAG TPA: hypothetical protein VMT42_01570, partial [candidate division Zixibacteria bacterium]|nr:hypothetical protein [candidate division Zixibacteria bacterium]